MDTQAIYVIWLREMKRFFQDRSQILVATVRPITWLFFMGQGLSPSFRNGRGTNYTQFVLPGIALMAILFTAIQSAISIIWDREFGFLKEMLVAPISRTSIVLGKAFGGTTLALFEGTLVLLLAPLLGIRLSLVQLVESFSIMVAVAFALSGLGITIASRMKTFEGFGAIMNFLVMPLFLLSGALFPLNGLPRWLKFLVEINPLTYGVDLLRGILLQVRHFDPRVSLSVIIAFATLMVASAVHHFNREEI